jgi:hypothetical protein
VFTGDELERLYRYARGGRFLHPADAMVVREVVGKSALSVLGEPGPR